MALGEDFGQVHEWLDGLYPIYGWLHREYRHHDLGVEAVRKKWGDQAAEAAILHIQADCDGEIPKANMEKWLRWGTDEDTRPSSQATEAGE